MPLTDRSKAKQSAFAQVREALVKFEGTVAEATFDQWGGKLIDEDTGKPIPPREFLEVQCVDVEVLEVTEELAMAIDEWNFRVNCSDFEGSFWVEKFLESADKHKLQIPDELEGKRIVWEKVTLKAYNKSGVHTPKFDSTNFVIAEVKEGAPKAKPKVISKTAEPVEVEGEEADSAEETPIMEDPMESALEIAVGKTEAQFRSAISTDERFQGSPLLPMAKAGAITTALVNEGRLELVKKGNKDVYQVPE